MALEKKLLGAKKLKCKFTTVSTSDWEGDKTKATVAPSKLEIGFSSIDVDERHGRGGRRLRRTRSSREVRAGLSAFHPDRQAGPLYVTTVLTVETTPGHFKAMHTRHEFVPTKMEGFTSRPETYVGECTPSG